MKTLKKWWKANKPCFHKSDRDYGMDGLGGDTLSYCVKCNRCINHSVAPWPVLHNPTFKE